MTSDASTPLMRQYNGIKQQVPNALLMFRLGDFYELFFEDAVLAARELEITLTSRNKEKGAAIPMAYDSLSILAASANGGGNGKIRHPFPRSARLVHRWVSTPQIGGPTVQARH